jgi:small subunit ribosomal protein S21e
MNGWWCSIAISRAVPFRFLSRQCAHLDDVSCDCPRKHTHTHTGTSFTLLALSRLTLTFTNMQNEQGVNVDLYVPRKCSWTSRLIESKDHASVQINIANVDPVTGLATGDFVPLCIAGYVRFKSESDMAITALVQKKDAALVAAMNAALDGSTVQQ